jgi:hypothetical protein
MLWRRKKHLSVQGRPAYRRCRDYFSCVSRCPQLTKSGDSTSRFLAHSAAVALNICPKVCLAGATPFDRMGCKAKSSRSQLKVLKLVGAPGDCSLTGPIPYFHSRGSA